MRVAEAGTTEGIFVPPPPPVQKEPPTRTRCEVYWPVGPATPGYSGRISRINHDGSVTTIAGGLPSFANNTLIGGDRIGPAAVAFRNERLYTVISVGGCSHAHPSDPNVLARVFADGSNGAITDLSNCAAAWTRSRPPTVRRSQQFSSNVDAAQNRTSLGNQSRRERRGFRGGRRRVAARHSNQPLPGLLCACSKVTLAQGWPFT